MITDRTDSLFRRLTSDQDKVAQVTVELDGFPLSVPAGASIAAALLAAGVARFRSTPVSGSARAPYCMMGVCFDCLIEVDGEPNRQACLIEVRDGMKLRRQEGARELAISILPETEHDHAQ
jgi:predicted molibdopterin-dependent oxidoreductase YjgC